MIRMTLGELASVVGGRLDTADGSELITGTVEFDSRAMTKGGLFVALRGEHVDGHDYAAAALAAGAAGVLAARPVRAPAVVVVDVLAALARLAAHLVRRLPELDVIGLTGSSGKTTTKDLLASVLSSALGSAAPAGFVVAPPGSFNNELGHPWTVLRADEHTRYLVLELAARGIGHIAALCAVAPPRIGLVLNVGSAHMSEFGSADAIAAAKGELVEALPAASAGGVAALNFGDPRVAAMAGRTAAKVVTFGRVRGADVCAEGVTLDERGRARFRLVTAAGAEEVALRAVGEHQVLNALGVAAVAGELGLGPDQIAARLSAATVASRWRMEVTDRSDGVTVINDAYNANPESMRAALHALSAISGRSRRRWAVLGPMAELGSLTETAHAQVGLLAGELGVQRLVAVGIECYGKDSMVVPDVAAALDLLRRQLRPHDVVLVKASRAAGLERVVEGLLNGGTAATSEVGG